MIRIDSLQALTCNALNTNSLHDYTAEASSLGLPPGMWPSAFLFAEYLGNGQPFYRTGYHFEGNEHERDLVAVDYKQHLGCLTLRVYND
jgi:hypothetical protein